MWITEPDGPLVDVTCPFCGLACDDLQVETNAGEPGELTNACPVARAGFADAFAADGDSARIDGRSAGLADALDRSASLLREARAPVFAGLATDVNGMRAALALADRCGATLDHANGEAMLRNQLVLQDSGWFTTTFSEVRNRADLILIVGAQCFERFPRLFERVLLPPDALFSPPGERELVLIGPWDPSTLAAEIQATSPTVIPVPLAGLAGLAGVLRGLIAGRPVRSGAAAGVPDGMLESLAARLLGARYSVVAWTAAELDFPHAELTVQALVELVRDLNRTTRAAALPLAGTMGDLTANQVCTWQTGYPLPAGLAEGRPRYEPLLYRYPDLLERGEADLLLWISALPGQAAPLVTHVPTILLSRFQVDRGARPEVQIPVGTPGVDHPGHWYRSDSVCPLPLGRLRISGLPSVAEVLDGIGARLDAEPSGDPSLC